MRKVFEYRGFEEFYDMQRDMCELFEPWNGEFKDLDPEFTETIKITVEVVKNEEVL